MYDSDILENTLILGSIENDFEKYFANYLIAQGIRVLPVYKKKPKLLRADGAINRLLHLPKRIWFNIPEDEIKKYKYIILFGGNYCSDMIKLIRKVNPNCNLVIWLWDTVSKNMAKIIKECDKLNCPVYSFDKDDCKKYNLNYCNQVCIKLDKTESAINNSDVFFCGRDKSRIVTLKLLNKYFAKIGKTRDFMVLPDKHKIKIYKPEDKEMLINRWIDYDEVVEHILATKCIIDIPKATQFGLTWRPLEALFYGKKLITTNSDIKNYDFYNENNIFVLTDNNINEIEAFLEKKYQKISSEIIEKYTYKYWICSFFKS